MSHQLLSREGIKGKVPTYESVATQSYGANSDRVRVGLVGCGGRGTGAARDAMMAGPNIELVAMCDIFKARVNNSLTRLKRIQKDNPAMKDSIKVTPDSCFAGLDAYKKVIDSGIDYVLLCTPPGFRPDHIEYAVKKGRTWLRLSTTVNSAMSCPSTPTSTRATFGTENVNRA
ncbi:MAG: Gfo/Idh/MocA family oxidoreductase [Planctomycetota bacterium]|jgi:hypothetical protein